MNYRLSAALTLLTVTLAASAQGIGSGTLKNMREQRDVPQQMPISKEEEELSIAYVIKTNTAKVLHMVQPSTGSSITLTPKGMTVEIKKNNQTDVFRVSLGKNDLKVTHGPKSNEIIDNWRVSAQAGAILQQLSDIQPGTDINRVEQIAVGEKTANFVKAYREHQKKPLVISLEEIRERPGAGLFYAPISSEAISTAVVPPAKAKPHYLARELGPKQLEHFYGWGASQD